MQDLRVRRIGQLAALLRTHREGAGLTQRQLAVRARISVGALQDLEQGRTVYPRQRSLSCLAAALQLSEPQREELTSVAAACAAAAQSRPQGKARQDGPGLRVEILGPLASWRDGSPAELGSVRQRAVLGLLALHADTSLSRAAIIDALWREAAPPTAVTMIQAYIGRIRRLLGCEAVPGGGARLSWDGSSYRLSPGSVTLDLADFSDLARRARQAVGAGDSAAACEMYDRALGLWRGQPLEDIDVLRNHPAVTMLGRQRAAVVIEYAGAAASAGLPDRVLTHLEAQAAREPLDERVHAQLMLTLAATGRQGAALQVQEDLTRRLAEELGVSPGPEFSAAHLRVLRQQVPSAIAGPRQRVAVPGLASGVVDDAEPAGHAPPVGQAVVPRQLPPGVADFAGRDAELAVLSGLLGDQVGQTGTVVISAIGGMAGVGKTALAIHWAHRVADEFPDGQLYVNLGGFGPSADPVPPAQAVRGFLEALGVAPQRIPAEPSAQAGLYRSLLSGRRMLIVLDNSRDEAHLRPLLPASPGCVVVVTSRIQLTGLVAAEGARLVNLDVLTDAEAREMLARRLGAKRVAAEPDAESELISLCARLPLALAVIAARAATHPGFPLAMLATELRDERSRLQGLDGGEPTASVQAVFSWSYQNLTPPAARMFRRLGLHPPVGITAHAAASLAAIPLDHARELLRELARGHLLTEPAPGRFAFHDLLRAYAARQGQALDGEEDRRAALTGLFDYYLAAAGAAMDTLAPAERHRRPLIPAPATPLPPLDTPDTAGAWLEAERAALVAVARQTATGGWPDYATRLSTILFRYYRDIGGHYSDALIVHAHALHAAEESGDRGAQADALMNWGMVEFQRGCYQQAAGQIERAVGIYGDLGDRRGQARAHSNLGVVRWGQSRYQPSADHFRQALDLHRELADRFGQAASLDNLGTVLGRLGRYRQAAGYHRQALVILRGLGHRRGEARALANLGVVLSWQGRGQEAAGQLERALAVFREFGDRHNEGDVLNDLGTALCCQGLYEKAAGHHQKALAMFRDLGNRSSEAEALNGAGEALSALGQTSQARAHHRQALTVASQIGNQHLEARSHNGLASTYDAAGDLDKARHHWERALALYASIGVPEAGHVRARLNTLSRSRL